MMIRIRRPRSTKIDGIRWRHAPACAAEEHDVERGQDEDDHEEPEGRGQDRTQVTSTDTSVAWMTRISRAPTGST